MHEPRCSANWPCSSGRMRPISLEASILTPAGSWENPLREVRIAADAAPAPSMKPRRVNDFDIDTSRPAGIHLGRRKIPNDALGVNLAKILAQETLLGETLRSQGTDPLLFAAGGQVLILSQNSILAQVSGRLSHDAGSLIVGHAGQSKRRNNGIRVADAPLGLT